jgi:hypothetical protein
MSAKLLLPLPIAAALLGQGCNSTTSRPAPSEFVAKVSKVSPSGWRVITINDVLTLRRDAPVWIMGYISRSPQYGTKEEFFKRDGQEIHYELRLRFVPVLSQPEYESLRAARLQAAARLKGGAPGKSEYTELQKHYEQRQVPLFFTDHYSVFVDRWADIGSGSGYRIEPLFVEVYPPEAASEIEGVVKNFGQMFKQYDKPGT